MGWASIISACARWLTFALAGFVFVAPDVAVFVLYYLTDPSNTSPVIPVISSSLVTFTSALLHSLRIYATRPIAGSSLPYIRQLLVGALVIATVLNVAFIVLLYRHNNDFYLNLTKLTCIFYAALVEVFHLLCMQQIMAEQLTRFFVLQNITRIWTFIHSFQKWNAARLALYSAISLQVLFFGAGTFLLLRYDLQVVWGLAAMVIWLHLGLFVLIHIYYCNTRFLEDSDDPYDPRREERTRTLVTTGFLGFGALASTSLLCIGAVYDWKLLFMGEFTFLKAISIWAIARSPLSHVLRERWKRHRRIQARHESVEITFRVASLSLPCGPDSTK
jgi:hypothetical protein